MHAPKTFILTSVLALFSTTSAAPAPAETTTTAGCSALTIVYSTVEKPFALTALPDDSIFSWSVFLRSTSASQVVEPYISLVKLPLPSFRLTNGTLTTGGADSLEFPAFFGPTIDIFPPVLQPLQFGGPSSTPAEFYVKPSCDVEDNGYLELRATQRKFHHFTHFYGGKFVMNGWFSLILTLLPNSARCSETRWKPEHPGKARSL